MNFIENRHLQAKKLSGILSSACRFTLVAVALVFATTIAYGQTVMITYSSAGSSYSVNVPNGAIDVTGEAWGGGGGGGSARACGYKGIGTGAAAAAASGGGGGGYSLYIFGTLVGNYNIEVAKGGNPSSTDAAAIECNSTYQGCIGYSYAECSQATAGGASKVTHTSSATSISANGGYGGKSAGADANGSSCNIKYVSSYIASGGAGTSGNGQSGTGGNNSGNGIGGAGGTGSNGGTGGLSATAPSDGMTQGNNGTQPGGGGGGAAARSSSSNDCRTAAGGTGAAGRVIVSFSLPSPAVNVTPSLICQNGSITFTITNYQNNCTYTLYKGGVSEGTFSNAAKTINASDAGNHTYTVRAQYTITQSGGTLTASGTGTTYSGNTVTIESSTLAVTVNPKPTFTVTNPNLVCEPNSIDLASTVSASSNAYTWEYFSNAAGTTTINPTVNTSGTYYIQTTSSVGCKSDIVPVVVTVNPKPAINTVAQTICSGDILIMTLSDNSMVGGVWSSSKPDTADFVNSALPNNLVAGINAGVTQIVYTLNGCVSNPVTIAVALKPEISCATKRFTVCSGDTVAWKPDTATGCNTNNRLPASTKYTWIYAGTFPDGDASTQTRDTTEFSQTLKPQFSDNDVSKTYSYLLTPHSNGCAGNPIDVFIEVHRIPETFILSDPEICVGEKVKLIIGGTPPFTLTYNLNGMAASPYTPAQSDLLPYSTKGTAYYFIEFTAENVGDFDFELQHIEDQHCATKP